MREARGGRVWDGFYGWGAEAKDNNYKRGDFQRALDFKGGMEVCRFSFASMRDEYQTVVGETQGGSCKMRRDG